jgi:hypothetical protein
MFARAMPAWVGFDSIVMTRPSAGTARASQIVL